MNASTFFKSGLLTILTIPYTFGIITTLNRNDPVPPYTTDNPFALLGTNYYEYLKGQRKELNKEHFSVEIMPFYQRASRAADCSGNDIELGNIGGKWNMIALLPFNKMAESGTVPDLTNTNEDLPCGTVHPQVLVDIRDELLTQIDALVSTSAITSVPPQLRTVQGLLELQTSNADNKQTLGFFSVPMTYRKEGLRFNGQLYIGKGFGVDAQWGIADIRQCASFIDQTTSTTVGNPFNTEAGTYKVTDATWQSIKHTISDVLMSQLDNIASSTQIDRSLCDFHETAVEDVYAEVFWRQPIRVNRQFSADEYPKFLFIPFFAVGGAFGVAKALNPKQVFAVPFGNNKHNGLRVRAGLSLDFYETLQLSLEAGGTFWNTRRYCGYPMPNNDYQWPFFPHTATFSVKPGVNWHVVLGMNAEDFLDHFSCAFDYIYVSHDKDCFTLCGPNTAIAKDGDSDVRYCRQNIHPLKPAVLKCNSEWTVQVFDAALNYGISPNAKIGIMMQIPFKRKNAYRSSTFAVSVFGSF